MIRTSTILSATTLVIAIRKGWLARPLFEEIKLTRIRLGLLEVIRIPRRRPLTSTN
jgi:hypothetical protein